MNVAQVICQAQYIFWGYFLLACPMVSGGIDEDAKNILGLTSNVNCQLN